MSTPAATQQIPGYDFGTRRSAESPLSDEDLRNLEQTVGWSSEDRDILLKHSALFQQQAEAMVDSWRSVIAAQPHLSHWFVGPDGKPDDDYKARVKPRFVQWVIDVALRPHDRAWLNYQEEIGLRHTPAKKNLTDSKQTPPSRPAPLSPRLHPRRASHPQILQRLHLEQRRTRTPRSRMDARRPPPHHPLVPPLHHRRPLVTQQNLCTERTSLRVP